jgi:hypothetical protein
MLYNALSQFLLLIFFFFIFEMTICLFFFSFLLLLFTNNHYFVCSMLDSIQISHKYRIKMTWQNIFVWTSILTQQYHNNSTTPLHMEVGSSV